MKTARSASNTDLSKNIPNARTASQYQVADFHNNRLRQLLQSWEETWHWICLLQRHANGYLGRHGSPRSELAGSMQCVNTRYKHGCCEGPQEHSRVTRSFQEDREELRSGAVVQTWPHGVALSHWGWICSSLRQSTATPAHGQEVTLQGCGGSCHSFKVLCALRASWQRTLCCSRSSCCSTGKSTLSFTQGKTMKL